MGFCIGGHLAYRAALHPEVRAAAVWYPTDIHKGSPDNVMRRPAPNGGFMGSTVPPARLRPPTPPRRSGQERERARTARVRR